MVREDRISHSGMVPRRIVAPNRLRRPDPAGGVAGTKVVATAATGQFPGRPQEVKTPRQLSPCPLALCGGENFSGVGDTKPRFLVPTIGHFCAPKPRF